jgi:crotonobetainyl-CoA:carnitine CoA-transferase CaiB-like acyl-CoA transferase
MAGALQSLRVVDFGQYIAGPMTAMLLGDQGADVIHIDPPGGPRWDTPANATWNRGKRSIVFDLKDAADVDVARQLAATADVLIENFRPGVMERLGLGADAMMAANPRLIYCSLPGFASDDARAALPAWEGAVAAATGTYRARVGGNRPVYNVLPFSSSYAAFQAAVAIAMALNVRERDGVGQAVEVPLFDATFAAIGFHGLRVHQARDDAAATAAMGRMLGWTRQFRCKDGRWFMYHAGNQNARAFLEATGAAAWLDSGADGQLTPRDTTRRVEDLFATRTAAEWEAFCARIGTEGAICRTSAEWLDDPQALASAIIVDTVDPVLGKVRGPGINIRMSATPGELRGPSPVLDADRAEILAAAALPLPARGISAAETTIRSAMDGVRVIDLCIILAGPTSARTLGEFGADVIKIDSPHRESVAFHNDINRAKRSLLLDLKNPAGLEVFWKLVDTADVVVQNFRKGVADRLGIGYEAVRARRPDIVYGSLNTYGHVGPYADRPGHEQIAQAATGMQERYGGDGQPMLAPFAVNDYGTGFMGAYAMALALFHRKRTGEGQHVDTALAYTATMLQSALLQDYPGKQWAEPRGQESLGSGPLNRAYEASDGWLFLTARTADLSHLSELADVATLSGADLEAVLEQRFRTQDVAIWIEHLNAAGIGAQPIVADIRTLMDDPWAQAHGLSITREHERFGPITTTGATPRLSLTPPSAGRPASKPGADAASILAEIGMLSDLDRLVREKVVVLDGVGVRP